MKVLLVTLSMLFLVEISKAQVQPNDREEDDTKPAIPVQTEKQKSINDSQKAAALYGMQKHKDAARGKQGVRIMSYNVENLFDTENDSLINDEDFLPTGNYGWTKSRFYDKLEHIYKTVTAVGGWESPDIIGFCEIENKYVIEELLRHTPLRKEGYEIVHENSTDQRGIDVAILYKKSKFKYLGYEILRPVMPFDTTVKTRDVLYVKGIALNQDTLHIFMNHWPSRRGGQTASEPRRDYVASILRKKIDELQKTSPDAKIVVMGDFNDEYHNKSIHITLRAKNMDERLAPGDLYNYMGTLSKNWKLGSDKFGDHWGSIDNMIVSQSLLDKTPSGLRASREGAVIFCGDFLLEPDERNFGLRPFRTYSGPKYLGGFSDHLPVYIDLMLQEN